MLEKLPNQALSDIVLNTVPLAAQSQWPHLGIRCERIADADAIERRTQRVHHIVVAAARNDNSAQRRTHLVGYEARRIRDRCRDLANVIIIEHDCGRLVASMMGQCVASFRFARR